MQHLIIYRNTVEVGTCSWVHKHQIGDYVTGIDWVIRTATKVEMPINKMCS